MDFEYEIKNGEVTIIGYKDESVTSLIIPEYIEGLLVTKIGDDCFYYHEFLEEIIIPNSVNFISGQALPSSVKLINNIQVNSGINIINNRFIYFNEFIYIIHHQISDDYFCVYNNEYSTHYGSIIRFFIGGELFFIKFKVK